MIATKKAIQNIDLLNSEDPNKTTIAGKEWSNEVLYSQRMTEWLFKLNSNPSAALQIAVRANHIMRWKLDRKTYPMDRQGYLQWREDLIAYHISETIKIMKKLSFPTDEMLKLEKIMSKQHIKQDADCQTYEDVICLVFLEHYFASFYSDKQVEEDKMITILRKTWFKMSKTAQAEALKLDMPEQATAIVHKALNK